MARVRKGSRRAPKKELPKIEIDTASLQKAVADLLDLNQKRILAEIPAIEIPNTQTQLADINTLTTSVQSLADLNQQRILQPLPEIAGLNVQTQTANPETLNELVEQEKLNRSKTTSETVEQSANNELPKEPYPSEEKYGIVVLETKNAGEIVSLLREKICVIEFTRTSFPRGKRVMRCTLNPRFIPSRAFGIGSYGSRILVWDVELQNYRSFYANMVHKISYDENPGQVG
jgi:hypothetical protein